MQTKIHRFNKIILFLFIFPLTMLMSCVEEYFPDLKSNYESLLVVNGKITNKPGPYTVTLSSSTDVTNPEFVPRSNAIVIILDDAGNSETLYEVNPGVYQTSETGIRGIIGRRYKIEINSGGENYESAFEELLAPEEIDAVYIQQETQVSKIDVEAVKLGYQFYVTSKSATKKNNYYFWELEETYEDHSPYTIIYQLDADVNIETLNINNLPAFPHKEKYSRYYCWKTNVVPERFVSSTEHLSIPKISDFPLNFIAFESEKLKIKYCLSVKQLSISKNAYHYFNSLYEQNNDLGSLYAKQPYQITGNMINADNPDEIILGFFLTASVSETTHVFAKRPPNTIWNEPNCSLVYKNLKDFLSTANFQEWPVYLTHVTYTPGDGVPAYVSPDCLDCTLRGGSLVKPTFWDW